jgi:hypothetical protein
MNKVILDSGEMSIEGNRERIVVIQVSEGIEVLRDSLYNDEPAVIHFYRHGNYPPIPKDWDRDLTGIGLTEDMRWYDALDNRLPDKVIDPYKRAKKMKKKCIYWFLDG